MYKLIAILIATVAVANAGPFKHYRSRENYDNIDYYDCSTKPDGNYVHPSDCTRFIMCSNGRAADMACADCDQNNVAGCAGSLYLNWNQEKYFCDYPQDSPCDPTPATETTTEEAHTEPTEAPIPSTPPPSDNNTSCPFQEGESCHADECRHCGYCVDKVNYFLRCDKTKPTNPHDPITGIIVRHQCGPRSWWNSDLKPDDVAVGGACDSWEGLSQELRDQYNADPVCNPPVCEWGQDIPCTGGYWYFDPKTMPHGSRLDLQCNSGYIWDPSDETCRERSEVSGCST